MDADKKDGIEEFKIEATDETMELEQQKDSFTQVLKGTPSSASSPINYENIIVYQNDPLN